MNRLFNSELTVLKIVTRWIVLSWNCRRIFIKIQNLNYENLGSEES